MIRQLFVCSLLTFQSIHAFSEENFLLIDGVTNETVLRLGHHLNERISPCSTFKMTLSLMGYDAEVLANENTPVWDFQEGYDNWLPQWRAPQTPLSWMNYSCVWYAKLLSLELGPEKVQTYLDSFQYGNQDISSGLVAPGPKNPPWINSSLEISPKEQVAFIQKMMQNKLPISSRALQMTKALVFKEVLPEGWKLFGKTGWSGSDITKDGKTQQHAWFVGWVEKDNHFFPFAYLIRDQKIDLDQRIPRVKQLLIGSNVMNDPYHD